jgi:hypothetical protein
VKLETNAFASLRNEFIPINRQNKPSKITKVSCLDPFGNTSPVSPNKYLIISFLEYLVKWEHFSLYECAWEPKCHLPSCIIDDYTNPLTVTESRLQHISDLFLEHTHKRLSQRSVQQFYIYAELDLFRYLFGETGEVFPNGPRQLTLVILDGLFCLLITRKT